MTQLFPGPMTPADCDLTDFQFMPLEVRRLRDSDLASLESPEACWAAVLLWCASWHQVPAASLPDDDRVLSNLAGYGRVVSEWLRVREGALRGWVKCSDGRLYHPVVAEKANESWRSKVKYAYDKLADRTRKANTKREKEGLPAVCIPTIEQWISDGRPGQFRESMQAVPPEKSPDSGGNPQDSAGIPEASGGIPQEGKRNNLESNDVGGPHGGKNSPPEAFQPSHGHPSTPHFGASAGSNEDSAGIYDYSGGTGELSAGIPPENALKGQGQGQGELKDKNQAAAATTPPRAHVHTPAHEAAPDAPPSPGGGQQPETRYLVLLRQWEKARGKMFKGQGNDPRLSTWAEKKVTEAQLRDAYDQAVADRDQKQDPAPVNTGFLDTFLAKVLIPRAADSALNWPGATGTAKPWQASWSGIVAKGAELGIEQGKREMPHEFKARVIAAAGMTDEERAQLRADFGVTV